MKLKFILSLFLVLGFVSAGTMICIDLDSPSAPSNLAVTSSGMDIILVWPEVIDEPSCSGVEYYNISRNGGWIGQVNGSVFTFVDENVPYGTYNYTVFAVDLVGHNSGDAIKNDVVLSKPNGGGDTHVSGGGSSYICKENWVCGNWSDCIGNNQRRLCEDMNKCGPENDKPITYLECGVKEDDDYGTTWINDKAEDNTENHANFLSTITGAVTGVVGTAGGIGVIVFMVLVCGGFVAIRIRKKR